MRSLGDMGMPSECQKQQMLRKIGDPISPPAELGQGGLMAMERERERVF